MKTKIPFLFLMLACLAFASCKKDEANTCDPDGDCFSAKVDGDLFVSDNVTGTLVIANAISIGATYGINPVPTFGLLLATTAEGTYSFSTPDDVAGEYSPGAFSATLYGSTSGSLTIEKHDVSAKRISGTFNFEGEDASGEKIQISEGSFDLTYQ